MLRAIAFLFLFTSGVQRSFAQTKRIEWRSIHALDTVSNQLVFMDVYTDWCGWCKELDRTTFADTNMITYINQHYVPIKFNAESRESIMLDKHQYNFNVEHNAHDLAIKFSAGRLSYPLTLIINTKTHQMFPFPGYMPAKDFEPFLKFFATHESVTREYYQQFINNFIAEWK